MEEMQQPKQYDGEERRHAQQEFGGEDRRKAHAANEDTLEQENEQLQQQDQQDQEGGVAKPN